ncbi:MAG: hypothetical protein IMZ53_08430 [Thermoplasmata archaeon]|nr:hypothetical protein [Thermoplasmata archaeon]MBE3140595.1 hypothetical protein [Thermoplasmata archaeon]
MSQLIRAMEQFNIQLLGNLFGDTEEIEYNESVGFFTWKGERLTDVQIDKALNCKFDGGERFSLTRNRCEYPRGE